MQTNDGVLRGVSYADINGAVGFLNGTASWRLKAEAGKVTRYSDGGTGYALWDEQSFSPSDYLPLTGGTLSGNLVANGGIITAGLAGGSYGIVQLNAGPSGYNDLRFSDNGVATWTLREDHATDKIYLYNRDDTGGILGAVWSAARSTGVMEIPSLTTGGAQVWASGKIPVAAWQLAADGTKRFHFGNNGTTYIEAPNSLIEFRNGSDAWMARVNNGTIYSTGEMYAQSTLRVIRHATSRSSGNITFSTAAPSGGADGDIWFVYT
jgi:hypothetical protein